MGIFSKKTVASTENAIDLLCEKWCDDKSIPLRPGLVAPARLLFEEQEGVRLPSDFAAYLARADGFQPSPEWEGLDVEGFVFLPLDKGNLESSNYLIFCRWCIGMRDYAICVEDSDRHGEVLILMGATGSLVANSFSEFVELYLRNATEMYAGKGEVRELAPSRQTGRQLTCAPANAEHAINPDLRLMNSELERYPTNVAQASLAKRLNLPHDESMQDWECEVADVSRFEEFFSAYDPEALTDDERFSLMEILVQCVDDAPADIRDAMWGRIASLLSANVELHATTITYWSQPGETESDAMFNVSMNMRSLLASCR